MPKKALLVIDVDHACGWRVKDIRSNSSKRLVARNIKAQLANWRARNGLIVFVVYGRDATGQEAQVNGRKQENCVVCDRNDSARLAKFLEHRHGNTHELAFVKKDTDAFTNQNLAEYLKKKSVTEVVLAGCQTFSCVRTTAQGAAEAGFNITLLRDLVFAPFDKHYDTEERWLDLIRATIQMNSNSKLSVKIE